MTADTSPLAIHPLTPERWADLEELFGEHGAYGGCWCMWWRCTRREFERRQGEGNRRAMKAIVDSGEIPGIIAYESGRAVGWCSVAPRERFGSLERSPVLKRLDDRATWALVCLYVHKDGRGRGVARALVRGAVDYVKRQVGPRAGVVIEAYPSAPDERGRIHPLSAYMGTPALFAAEGFVEVARASKSKIVMRYYLEERGEEETGVTR